MAITNNDIKFLFYAKKLGVSFEKTLTLGRLRLYGSRDFIQTQINYFRNNEKELTAVDFKDSYSEPLFDILGGIVESMDYSNYENATIIHDLNNPIDESLKNKYTTVLDSGTIEHVFNFPVAIKNCMEALKVGGHYIGNTPVNNTMGHGFYQFSPELFCNIFSKENGFEIVKLIIAATNSKGEFNNWYEVINPTSIRSRVVLVNNSPTYLFLIAKKISAENIFAKNPQQSDYSTAWSISDSIKNNKSLVTESKTLALYRKIVPVSIKSFLKKTYNAFATNNIQTDDLGLINSDHFKKIEEL